MAFIQSECFEKCFTNNVFPPSCLCSSRLVFSERSILRLSQQQLSSSRHFPTCCHCHHSRCPDLRQPGLRLLPPSTSSTTSVPIPPLHPVFSLIAQPCRLSHSETLHQPAVAVLLMVRLCSEEGFKLCLIKCSSKSASSRRYILSLKTFCVLLI